MNESWDMYDFFSGIKPYLCDICGYGTNLRVKMDLHMATKHNEDKILAYVCEVCDYKCSNQLHLRAHLQIVHLEGLTPFECGVSISQFYNWYLLLGLNNHYPYFQRLSL